MKERPILMSGPLVRALLDGRKTQTRRLMAPPPQQNAGGLWVWKQTAWDASGALVSDRAPVDLCPYGQPGDRLWVRETFGYYADPGAEIVYRASEPDDRDMGTAFLGWRPSIHMPRRASRITLRVTSVRVERLQAITEEDARAEGLPLPGLHPVTVNGAPALGVIFDPLLAFATLWDAINGTRASWASNPWVWVVGFEREGTT